MNTAKSFVQFFAIFQIIHLPDNHQRRYTYLLLYTWGYLILPMYISTIVEYCS